MQNPPRPQSAQQELEAGSAGPSRQTWRQTITLTRSLAAGGAAVLLGAACAASYYLGARQRHETPVAAGGENAAATIWTCSMHPQVRLPHPGKCPICFMDLIPLKQSNQGAGHPRELKMTADAAALADIQTTPVRRQFVTTTVRLVGKVDYDETKLAEITAWTPGRLDRLFIDFTGVTVRKGDHLVEMYSPDLVVAQRELILAWNNYQKYGRARNDELLKSTLNSAEEKLRLLGLTKEQLERIKQSGAPADHVTIYAPSGGVVIHKNASEGMYVKTGTPIYTIADLSQVWVFMDAYESDVAWLRYGQEVEFSTEAFPGEIFKGRVAFIDPVLSEKTRTVRVRVNVPNDDQRLKPGMFVRAIVKSRIAESGQVIDESLAGKWVSPHHPEIVRDGPGKCPVCGVDLVPAEELGFVKANAGAEPPLVIPASAPLVTGKRAVVYVRVDPTQFDRDDVADWQKLVSQLNKPETGPRGAAQRRIASLLDDETRSRMASSGAVVSGQLKQNTLAALNRLLSDRELYQPNAWLGVEAPDDAPDDAPRPAKADLLRLPRQELRRLNRRLIESAFPGAIEPADFQPTFQGREVLLGHRAGDNYIVRYGLSEGEEVVTQGNFKIDSALQIAAKPSMMSPSAADDGGEPWRLNGAAASPQAGHPATQVEAPASFRATLSPIYQAYLAASDALAKDDLSAARKHVGNLLSAIRQVDPVVLDEDGRGRWKTVADAIAFAAHDTVEASNRERARRQFRRLSNAMLPMLQTFGQALETPVFEFHCAMAFENKGAAWLQTSAQTRNPYFGPTMLACGERLATFYSLAPLDVPEAFLAQLAGLYDNYLKMQTALSADKAPEAAAAARAMQASLQGIDTATLDQRAKQAWTLANKQLFDSLRGDLRRLSIEPLRKRFESLSLTMLAVADNFGHPGTAPLYKVYCPMAFNDQGAPWLQGDKEVANPYFGAKMLRCGSVQRTFTASAKHDGPQQRTD